MATIVVLGGAGGIGKVAVKALTTFDELDRIVVADLAADVARAYAAELGDPRLEAVSVDAASPESLASVIEGADVVVSCVGPFYRFGAPILQAGIDAGVNFVDVCDDLDATLAQLELDGAAKQAGVKALIGMGNSPGLANVLVRFCADHMLDQVESADIMHIHGGEPEEGGAVIKHRIHAMTNDVPLFVDGEFVQVRLLEESGRQFVREVDFPNVGTYPVFPYPHPETITLPRNIPGIRRATNLGVVVPFDYFQLTMDAARLGICTEEPLTVDGQEVIPREFAVQYILSRRAGLLEQAGMTTPRGCLRVEVSGTKDGEAHTYIFNMSSAGGQGAGEGTGIPAALGAILMLRGQVQGEGVLAPEAAVVPTEMIELAQAVIPHFGMGGGMPLTLEHHGPDGEVQVMELPL